jgi:hypothetical protein
MFEIKKAVRRALPMQIAFYGPSGSGKTFSALKFAAGLAGPGGKVAVIDTERGRASLYADNKKILADLPNGFDVVELDAPYHPERYIKALDVVEDAGYRVCLVDSASDSWDGPGGCCDIAEANKNMWTKPKMWNKKFMTRMQLSDMHIICLLKAQEKTKIIDKAKSETGKQEYIDLGVLPICEKGFFYPMLLGFAVDPKTHVSTVVKYQDDLLPLFSTPRLITKADGEMLKRWNDTGSAVDPNEQIRKRARSAADEGVESYRAFYDGLTLAQKVAIKPIHEELKAAAKRVDLASEPPTEAEMNAATQAALEQEAGK